MKILLLNISDIHVTTLDRQENQEFVLRKFIEDVEALVVERKKFIYNDVFVLVSGDLVFAASNDSYTKFDELIVQKLMKILKIGRSHFIIAPGNHDVTQNTIKEVEDAFLPIFHSKFGETKFNDLIRKKALKDILFGKFGAFLRYMVDTMGDKTYSLQANIREINDTWSVHVLNSAILSCGGYNGIDDQGHLGVDTRSLHKILLEDKHPKKILLMHHPEYFCMDWVSDELRALYGIEYALVLSGHKHSKFIYCDKSEGYIRCEAPQLLTDKSDTLGYNFIELLGDKLSRITYRQWSRVGREFQVGTNFLRGDNNGDIVFYDAEKYLQFIDNGLPSNKVSGSTDISSHPQSGCSSANKPHPNPPSGQQEKSIDKVSIPIEVSSYPQSEGSSANMPHPKAIDLGLPSGTKWASFNVGADKPENPGGYFAWGETEEKKEKDYKWKTYTHCDGNKVTCHNLGNDIAGTQYDVAYVKLGGNWRMPTIEQIEELFKYCYKEWITQKGVNGQKFTSKFNGNSIFLPAAGYRLDNVLYRADRNGYYWSSSQCPSHSHGACGLYFRSSYALWGDGSRCYGLPVRPVSNN